MSRTSHTCFASPLVRVLDVVCAAGCGNGRHEERCQAAGVAFVRSGTFVRRDRMGRHVADATQAVFFDPAEPYVVDHPVPGGDRCTLLVFDPDTLREAVRHERGDPERVFPQATRTCSASMHLAHRALLGAVNARDPIAVEESALRCLELVSGGEQDAPATRGGAAARAATLAADARVLIAGAFTGRVTLDGLARTLGVSPFRLCRAFRQATGGTLHQHLTRLRLAAALERLPQYRERLTDLALDHGFSSHSHFTHAFRTHFGRAPSALLPIA